MRPHFSFFPTVFSAVFSAYKPDGNIGRDIDLSVLPGQVLPPVIQNVKVNDISCLLSFGTEIVIPQAQVQVIGKRAHSQAVFLKVFQKALQDNILLVLLFHLFGGQVGFIFPCAVDEVNDTADDSPDQSALSIVKGSVGPSCSHGKKNARGHTDSHDQDQGKKQAFFLRQYVIALVSAAQKLRLILHVVKGSAVGTAVRKQGILADTAAVRTLHPAVFKLGKYEGIEHAGVEFGLLMQEFSAHIILFGQDHTGFHIVGLTVVTASDLRRPSVKIICDDHCVFLQKPLFMDFIADHDLPAPCRQLLLLLLLLLLLPDPPEEEREAAWAAR